jgi:hypothetical protein
MQFHFFNLGQLEYKFFPVALMMSNIFLKQLSMQLPLLDMLPTLNNHFIILTILQFSCFQQHDLVQKQTTTVLASILQA